MFVIVPDWLHDKINAELDRALALWPEAEPCREHLYRQLLDYYNEHGTIPSFSIAKTDKSETAKEKP